MLQHPSQHRNPLQSGPVPISSTDRAEDKSGLEVFWEPSWLCIADSGTLKDSYCPFTLRMPPYSFYTGISWAGGGGGIANSHMDTPFFAFHFINVVAPLSRSKEKYLPLFRMSDFLFHLIPLKVSDNVWLVLRHAEIWDGVTMAFKQDRSCFIHIYKSSKLNGN